MIQGEGWRFCEITHEILHGVLEELQESLYSGRLFWKKQWKLGVIFNFKIFFIGQIHWTFGY